MALVSYRNKFRARVIRPVLPNPRTTSVNGTPVDWPPEWLDYLRLAWERLHRRALMDRGDDTAWLTGFARQLPCGSCRSHWDELLLQLPPDWNAYFTWTVRAHNAVNRKLGKPEMSVTSALARWAVRQSK